MGIIVRFDLKEAAINAVVEKVIEVLRKIFAEESTPCELSADRQNIFVQFENKSLYIYCETLDPYFFSPEFPRIVRLADISGNLKRKEFIKLLRESANNL